MGAARQAFANIRMVPFAGSADADIDTIRYAGMQYNVF